MIQFDRAPPAIETAANIRSPWHSLPCRCQTPRDFVPWRFWDAGELSVQTASLLRRARAALLQNWVEFFERRDSGRCLKWVKGGRGRQADGTAGLPQLRKCPCVRALTFRANSRRRAPRRLVCDRESARQHEVGRQLRWDHLRHPIAKARQVDACEQGFTAAQNDGRQRQVHLVDCSCE